MSGDARRHRGIGRIGLAAASFALLASGCGTASDGGAGAERGGGITTTRPTDPISPESQGSQPSPSAPSTSSEPTVGSDATTPEPLPSSTQLAPNPPSDIPVSSTSTTTTVAAIPGPFGTPAELDVALDVTHGSRSAGMVLLTFDAGAERGDIDPLLDLLAAEGIQSAFAFTGGWVRANPDAVRRLVSEGHVLVNHTDGHPSFTGFSNGRGRLPDSERITAIEDGDAVLMETAGVSSKPLFRPPYGDMDTDGLDLLPELGYPINLGWTRDCGGWLGISPGEALQRCLEITESGAIYLLHVGHGSREFEMLPDLIAEIRRRDLRFGRVDEFLTAAVAEGV